MKRKTVKKKTILDTMSRNELATWLIQVGKEKRLVFKAVSRFKTHRHFSMIFSEDAVSSELNFTMASVINRIERYSKPVFNPYKDAELMDSYKQGFKTNETNPFETEDPKYEAFELGREDSKHVNNKLRLETKSDVEGYFVAAFFKNIIRIYTDQKRQKRDCGNMIFLDDYSTSNTTNPHVRSKNSVEAFVAYEPNKKNEFKKTLTEIAMFLKKSDKDKNETSEALNKSQLAPLFLSIVNEKKAMTGEELREKFDWSPYLLRKNKEELILKIRSKFSDSQEDILEYLDNRESLLKTV